MTTILLTRPENRNESLRSALETLGATVLVQPTIEVRPPDSWVEVDDVLRRLLGNDSKKFYRKCLPNRVLPKAHHYNRRRFHIQSCFTHISPTYLFNCAIGLFATVGATDTKPSASKRYIQINFVHKNGIMKK